MIVLGVIERWCRQALGRDGPATRHGIAVRAMAQHTATVIDMGTALDVRLSVGADVFFSRLDRPQNPQQSQAANDFPHAFMLRSLSLAVVLSRLIIRSGNRLTRKCRLQPVIGSFAEARSDSKRGVAAQASAYSSIRRPKLNVRPSRGAHTSVIGSPLGPDSGGSADRNDSDERS